MKDYNCGVISSGASKEVNAFGNYIRNLSQGNIHVKAYNTNTGESVNAFSTVIGSAGSRTPFDNYNKWVITNVSGAALDVSVLIGHGQATESDVRITADVNALTRVDNRTMDKNSYHAHWLLAPSAANYNKAIIWNPAASGVVLVVDDFMLEANNTLGDSVNIGYRTDTTGWTMGNGPKCRYVNKYLDGTAASHLQVGYQVDAVVGYSGDWSLLMMGFYEPTQLPNTQDSYVIPEGTGLVLQSVLGTKMRLSCNIREEAI